MITLVLGWLWEHTRLPQALAESLGLFGAATVITAVVMLGAVQVNRAMAARPTQQQRFTEAVRAERATRPPGQPPRAVPFPTGPVERLLTSARRGRP